MSANNLPDWNALADRALAGELISRDEARAVLQAPDEVLLDQLAAAYRVRRTHFANRVRLHFLLNAQSGISDYDNPGFVPLQRTEYNAELYYGFHVTNWLTVRPNLQYIKSPGGVDEVDNALVVALKIQSSF